jgi:hypothetical protein
MQLEETARSESQSTAGQTVISNPQPAFVALQPQLMMD